MCPGYENTLTQVFTRTTMIPPLPGNSPHAKLINTCLQALNEFNMDIIGNFLQKDFSNVIHPKSLGVQALNKEAFLKHYAELGTGYGVSHPA